MPPKCRKTPVKKPSPSATKATPATPDPLLAAAEERAEHLEAEIPEAAVMTEEAATKSEEEIAPVVAKEEETQAVIDDKIGEGTVVKIEEETVVEEDVAVKLLDSTDDKGADGDQNEMEDQEEAADKVKALEVTSEHKEGDNGEENMMEAEPEEEKKEEEECEGNRMEEVPAEEELDEEDPEEEEDEDDLEDEEGDKQIVEDKEEGTKEGEVSSDDEEKDEDDPSIYVQTPLTERKKQKEFEIFIGGLDKGAVEEDLVEVFGVFGEIQSARIVRHPLTQKSKGFAFIRYASIEHAKKALTELKDGTEVKGKQVRISTPQDNDTLYLGNICKTWNRDRVLETLKSYGIEQIEDMLLPDDPRREGKIKGFAFVEFKSHAEAMTAFQHLRKPHVVFGCDVSAKVSFAHAPLHPCEEDLQKVKTVYVENIPKSWDEAKVKELCKQYGEIEKVQLSRNFSSARRKDFGFVEFSSRDSAVACVEGINSTQIAEDVNVKASFAKPVYKGRLAKQNRGGYKLQKDEETAEEAGKSKKKKKSKSKAVQDKKEIQPTLKTLNKVASSKSQNKSLKEKNDSQMTPSAKGKKRGRKGSDAHAATIQQSSKKARKNNNYGKGRGRASAGFSHPGNSYSSNVYMPRQSSYVPPATSYPAHSYPVVAGSHHRHTDMEPHAGYLPTKRPVRNPYEDGVRRTDAYVLQPRSSSEYARASTAQNGYPGYSSYVGYQAGYAYPTSGAYEHRRPHY